MTNTLIPTKTLLHLSTARTCGMNLGRNSEPVKECDPAAGLLSASRKALGGSSTGSWQPKSQILAARMNAVAGPKPLVCHIRLACAGLCQAGQPTALLISPMLLLCPLINCLLAAASWIQQAALHFHSQHTHTSQCGADTGTDRPDQTAEH